MLGPLSSNFQFEKARNSIQCLNVCRQWQGMSVVKLVACP